VDHTLWAVGPVGDGAVAIALSLSLLLVFTRVLANPLAMRSCCFCARCMYFWCMATLVLTSRHDGCGRYARSPNEN
jgi:hypothetical protein